MRSCCFYGDIRTTADSKADICSYKSWCIVDTIANHTNYKPFILQFFYLASLILRQHFSNYMSNACLFCNILSCTAIITGKHPYIDALRL